jgi:hypothetical protein
MHKLDSPARTTYNKDGSLFSEYYYIEGKPITDPFQILVLQSTYGE